MELFAERLSFVFKQGMYIAVWWGGGVMPQIPRHIQKDAYQQTPQAPPVGMVRKDLYNFVGCGRPVYWWDKPTVQSTQSGWTGLWCW